MVLRVTHACSPRPALPAALLAPPQAASIRYTAVYRALKAGRGELLQALVDNAAAASVATRPLGRTGLQVPIVCFGELLESYLAPSIAICEHI